MNWYLDRHGRVEGPFEEAQLAQMVSEGFVPWNSLVSTQKSTGYIPIVDHPTFAEALAKTSQAGMPVDLEERAAITRASIPNEDPALALPEPSLEAKPLSHARLLAIGAGLVVLCSAVMFSIARMRSGFSRTLDSIGEELVDFVVSDIELEDWPNEALENGLANARSSNREALRTALTGLDPKPRSRFASIHFRICSKNNSIEFEAYSIRGDLRIGGLVARTGDDCKELRGPGRVSATEADDRRISALADRALVVYERLSESDCDVPMVSAEDFEELDFSPARASLFVAGESSSSRRTACEVVRADASMDDPFVELGTISVVVSGEEDESPLGVISSRISRTIGEGYTLGPIEAYRLER